VRTTVRDQVQGIFEQRTLADSFIDAIMTGSSADIGASLFEAAGGKLGAVTSVIKMRQIVMSPRAWTFNIASIPSTMMANGNFSPTALLQAIQQIGGTVGSQYRSEVPEIVVKMAKHGLLETVQINELMKTLKKIQLQELVKQQREGRDRPSSPREAAGEAVSDFWNAVLRARNTSLMTLSEMYTLTENLPKLANFINEVNFVKSVNPNATLEQIEADAARRIKLTNYTYTRIPKLMRNLELWSITFYGTFMADTMRIFKNNLLLGLSDIQQGYEINMSQGNALQQGATTPEGNAYIAHGMKRVVGVVSAGAFLSGLLAQVAKTAGGIAGWVAAKAVEVAGKVTSEEEDEFGEEAMTPDEILRMGTQGTWAGKLESVVIGQSGRSLFFFDAGRANVGDVVTAIIRDQQTLEAEGDSFPVSVAKAAMNFLRDDYFSAGEAGRMFLSAAATGMEYVGVDGGAFRPRARRPRLEKDLPEVYRHVVDLLDKVGVAPAVTSGAVGVAESFFPMVAKDGMKALSLSRRDDVPAHVQAMAASTLIGVFEYNPIDALRGSRNSSFPVSFEWKQTMEEARNGFNQYLTTPGTFNEDRLRQMYDYRIQREYEAFEAIQRHVGAARRLGADDDEIASALEDNPSIPAWAVDMNVEGSFYPQEITERSLRSTMRPWLQERLNQARTQRERDAIEDEFERRLFAALDVVEEAEAAFWENRNRTRSN